MDRVDFTGEELGCITLNTGCWGDRNDPGTATRERHAGWAMTGVAAGAVGAFAWEYIGAPATALIGKLFVSNSVSQTTRVAMEGGRNSGFFRNIANYSEKSLQKAIGNLTKRIEEHEAKIADPAKYMTRENPSDPKAVERAISDWKKEIKNYSEQREIAKDVLRQKQNN